MAEETRGRSVMVAIDENECSRYALEWALDNFGGALNVSSPLILYTVQPFPNPIYFPSSFCGSARKTVPAPLSAPPELIQSMQEHQKKVAFALMEFAKSICARVGDGYSC